MGLGAYPAERRGAGSACSACTAPTRPTGRCTTATSCSASARASTTGSPGGPTPSRPGSFKVHIDIDPSSINKNIHVQVPIVGDVGSVLADMLALWKERGSKTARRARSAKWWRQIELWRGRNCLAYRNSDKVIKPQYALQRLEALTRDHDRYICTEVGQHQMWAAQYMGFDEPNRWMTSRRARHHGLRPSRPRSACRSPTPTRWSSTSPARRAG